MNYPDFTISANIYHKSSHTNLR